MIESDYVFMKPLGIPSTPPNGYAGWAFPFNYMNPKGVPVRPIPVVLLVLQLT